MKRGPGFIPPMSPFQGIATAVVVVLLASMFVLQACQAATAASGCAP